MVLSQTSTFLKTIRFDTLKAIESQIVDKTIMSVVSLKDEFVKSSTGTVFSKDKNRTPFRSLKVVCDGRVIYKMAVVHFLGLNHRDNMTMMLTSFSSVMAQKGLYPMQYLDNGNTLAFKLNI